MLLVHSHMSTRFYFLIASTVTGFILGYMIGKNLGRLIRLCTYTTALPQLEKLRRTLQVQAHRGGSGMRVESTLYAFAYAMDIEADVVEMDTLFTKDGIPVIWHDHRIEATKCKETLPGSSIVGKYIANLTLEEIKTLECGSQQSEGHFQARMFPGAKIQTLEEVLEFFNCYSDGKTEINLETKLDIRYPNETLPIEYYVDHLVPLIKKHNMLDRVYIQSFDWRSIIGIKGKFPETRISALIDETLVGLVEATFKMNWVDAAKQIGAVAIAPGHGSPLSNGNEGATIHTPSYIPFTTKELIGKAHGLGMKVIVWTVDDESTIEKVIKDGVDGIISNFPTRVGSVARDLGYDVKIGRKSVLHNGDHTGECFKGASHY